MLHNHSWFARFPRGGVAWCRWSGSNRHSFWEHDFESCASANSATPAFGGLAIAASFRTAKQKCGMADPRNKPQNRAHGTSANRAVKSIQTPHFMESRK